MSLLDDVSLMITPNGVAEDVLLGVLPTPIIGVELITNGDFATDSDWAKLNGSTISGGVGNVVANGNLSTTGANWGLTQDNVFTPSTPYMIKFRARQTSGSGNFEVAYSYGYILKKVITSSFVDYCIYFTTNSSGWNDLSFGGSTIGDTFEVDNVSVKEYTSADMDFTRATTATRVNSAGLVASVAIGIPRLDFTGGGCPHILSEPQRTNICGHSQEIINVLWVKSGGGTASAPVVTANNVVSPDGVQNADKVVFDLNGATSGSDFSLLSQSYTQTADTYTVSCYLKGESGGEKIFMDFDSQNTNIVTLTNDWVRYTFTKTVTSTGARTIRFGTRGSVATDDNPTVYIWGCQLEVGSYATSYIPTAGSTVTRNEELFTRTGIGDLINSAEGVIFVEFAALNNDGTNRQISLSDGTADNRVTISMSSVSNEIAGQVRSGGGLSMNKSNAMTQTDFNKVAIKWKVNDFAIWLNGTEVKTDSSGAAPIGLNQLSFDKGDGLNDFFGKIRQLQVYKTALSDTQLDDLTS